MSLTDGYPPGGRGLVGVGGCLGGRADVGGGGGLRQVPPESAAATPGVDHCLLSPLLQRRHGNKFVFVITQCVSLTRTY